MGNEIFFEGKKYISAKRGSQICGYNSDYIGQLCRKGELECKRVGRGWFVTEESLKNHQSEASKKPRGRISIYEREIREKLAEVYGDDEEVKPLEKNHIFYKPTLSPDEFGSKDKLDLLGHRKFTAFATGLTAVMLVFVIVSVGVISSLNYRQTVSIFLGEKTIESFENNFVEPALSVKNSVANVGDSYDLVAASADSVQEKAKNIFSRIYFGLASIGNKLVDAMFSVGRRLAKNDSESRERTGVTVVPASQDESVNDQVKKYITDSFSDETKIVPDENGNSGVIKPVFKKRDDQEYLYVIVPVKEPVSENEKL